MARRRATSGAIHVEDLEDPTWKLCGTKYSPRGRIAVPGEAVTCCVCLVKLSRLPGYANKLRGEGIDTRGLGNA